MMAEEPAILSKTSVEVDRQLGEIMSTFQMDGRETFIHLSVFLASEVRHIAIGAPKCITRTLKASKVSASA